MILHEMEVTSVEVDPINRCNSQRFPHATEECLDVCTHSGFSLNPLTFGSDSLHCLSCHFLWDLTFLIVICYLYEELLVPLVSMLSLKHSFYFSVGSPTLYSFAWLRTILSFSLRQLFMKSIITSCFLRNGVPKIAS